MEKPNRLDLEALKLIHKLEATLTIASSEQSNEREIRQMVWFKIIRILQRAFGEVDIGYHLIPTLAEQLVGNEKEGSELGTASIQRIYACFERNSQVSKGLNGDGFDSRSQKLWRLVENASAGIKNSECVEMAVSLCESWWKGNVVYENGAPQAFSYLTFSESVLLIEHRLSQDLTLSVSKEYIQRTPIVLVQMLAKLISSQNNNGSWGVDSDLETTTFAVLAIISISSLSYTHVLADEIQETLTKAGASLKLLRDNIPTPDEKANHSTIESITEAYSLVAMKRLQENGSTLFPINRDSVLATKVSRFAKWFSNTDYLNGEPSFMIKVSILEASFYRPILQDLRTKVFPQTNSKEGDKYMEYIPIMWVIPSTRRQLFLSPEYILDMLVLSMWIFLVDECMESNVIQFSANEFAQFRSTMGVHSAPDRGKENDLTVQSLTESPAIGKEPPLSHRLEAAISVFTRFIIDVLAYSHVENSSLSDRFELRLETVKYLLYHIEQLEENIRFSKQQHVPGRNTKFLTPRMPYHTWVHTVGAGHVSGPFAFAFLTCLLGGSVRKGRDCFGSVTQKLIAFKMNSHIGSFCRIYNDYGSVSRDREEFNINSINFPEFFPDHLENEAATHQGDKEAKKALLKAGVFERKCAIDTSQILCKDLEAEGEEGKRVSDAIQIYMGGCEQFSDMYLTRDVTNTVK